MTRITSHDQTSRPLLVLNVAHGVRPQWRWLEGKTEVAIAWRFFGFEQNDEIPRPSRSLIMRTALRSGLVARMVEADLIVSHHPRVSAWVALTMEALGVKCPHLAFMFNFTALPTGVRLRFMRRAFRTIDRFTVPSTLERTIYAETFGIDASRIDHVPWGIQVPDDGPLVEPPVVEPPYFCAVGGEGRDYACLFRAMREIPHIHLEVVCRPYNLEGLEIPPNVHVRTNIPRAEAYNIMRYSRGVVIPLRDSTVPCGHGTLVRGMYMGIPLIVSDTAGVADYVRHDDTALLAKLGDPASFAAQMQRLWDDPELGSRVASRARTFAEATCSERNVARWFDEYLRTTFGVV